MGVSVRRAVLALTAFAVGGGLTAAALNAEGVHSNLACKFENGTSTAVEGGVFKSQPAKPLSFDIVDVDLEAQSARLTTGDGNGAGTLRIVRALNANHFLEVVNEGFLNLTTVYDIDAASGTYPAVHSRHLGILGQPIFAQYSGMCSALPTP